jgi:putative FmdB family regulatory protein
MLKPLADYQCRYCKEQVEAAVADAPADCANCGGPMKRLFAAPGISLKGKGWAGPRSR